MKITTPATLLSYDRKVKLYYRSRDDGSDKAILALEHARCRVKSMEHSLEIKNMLLEIETGTSRQEDAERRVAEMTALLAVAKCERDRLALACKSM